ncbi:TetR/AcrR family transcriptional regulator [bacterium]|nr:TetR/AcrR family transcriptional regulator [bacterium]
MKSEERKAWERKQRETRIIDIAQTVIFEKGYEQATIIEIAKAAGYTKRSIYLYFKDKEDIFLAIVLRGLTLLTEMLESAYFGQKETARGLDAMGNAFYEFFMQHPEYLSLIMTYEANTCIYYKELKPEIVEGYYKNECQKQTDLMAEIMTRAITMEIDKGAIKTDLSSTQLMLILWAQVFGIMQVILMRKKHFKDAFGIDYKDLFEAFQSIVSKGISG